MTTQQQDFEAIRPCNDDEVKQVVEELLADRQFNALLRGFVPWLPQWLRNGIIRLAFIGVNSTLDFQLRFMKPTVKYVLHKCSKGATFNHRRIKAGDSRYTFVSNHRDIVLDSAILDVLLHDAHFPTTCEIAIGDNLLIYPWIKKLVRLNKAFTVKRGLSPRELLESSMLMSRYMHYAINQKKENIWIAQREGRAKDSSDHTQESVLKMMAMGGEGSPAEQLKSLHIVPLTISYEYDPCDWLKAQEFQQKRDNPAYKKSKQSDLDNMKTGIMGYKGRIHYECAACINTWLDELANMPKNEFFGAVAKRMDKEIHSGYRLFPGNYVALDELEGKGQWKKHYTEKDKKVFNAYIERQLKKIRLENPDWDFLRERILTMYANPIINKHNSQKDS